MFERQTCDQSGRLTASIAATKVLDRIPALVQPESDFRGSGTISSSAKVRGASRDPRTTP
jgi:hypothetical protein